jgi:BirA family biotin operon repressor/biotin-[acetyl-CoA-carboxylase] ligase
MLDDFLDADELCASTFVRHLEIHDSLGSTNDRAVELARDPNIKLPAIVAARHQTAGRGRGKNKWQSTEGALTFSVLLEPANLGIATSSWPQLSLATAIAVCDALQNELNPQSEIHNPKSAGLSIKWPNDVMLYDAKVSGILIESPGGTSPTKDRLIIGIGINVNNSWRSATDDLATQATSLADVTGHPHSLQNVLSRFLTAFKHRLAELSTNDQRLPQTWQELCWLSQKRVCVQNGARTIEGTCAGIDADGSLLVKTSAMTERAFSGTVKLFD